MIRMKIETIGKTYDFVETQKITIEEVAEDIKKAISCGYFSFFEKDGPLVFVPVSSVKKITVGEVKDGEN